MSGPKPLARALLLLWLMAHYAVDGVRPGSRNGTKVDDPEWDSMTPAERVKWCDTLSPLYENIQADLAPWKESGISMELQHATFAHHTARKMGQKGIAVGFKGGVAYVTDEPKFTLALGHHVGLFIVYLKVMALQERLFGKHMPDVEFVISTVDRPLSLALEEGKQYEPVMRFCKTDAHSDILIPNFHSYIEQYTGGLAPQLDSLNRQFPWSEKKDMLFGRFTPYFRHMHTSDPFTWRRGFKGAPICRNASKLVAECTVRHHFCDWAVNSTGSYPVDVSCKKRTAMTKHAAYKWLLHLDGQGLSSRFEQLLHLRSLVIREESGYRAYFYRLLKPREHYIPFWKDTPDEITDILQWAKANDGEAQRIAANAQAFVRKYLSHRGRACYWHRLLTEYAKLLKYKPGKQEGKYSSYWVPVNEFLEKTAKSFGDGKWYDVFKFMP
uniref:Glycosyl transferase CAP10 domain-containing protein n=1 Tax=Chlamydomonas leiostraca TaxID=1034604 RepID=A0A7S0WR46_9CHLO|mmetsp:Transcript_24525/g.62287  ORF Transcript_24525/g.62287 Transcript_24525/m.62287 type:complete len:440 (+) Transcript_24525:269-1588(+)